MTHSHDSLPRRNFFKTLGAIALPLLTSSCDSETSELQFRAGPKGKGKGKTRTREIEVGRALLEQRLIDDRQRCSLPATLANLAGVGAQVRINHAEYGSALYTVDELRSDDNPDYVRINLAGRLRIGSTTGFAATISNKLTADLSEAEAEAQDEFIERVVDGHGDGLVVLAPHGGGIEPHTCQQAERLTAKLAGFGASSWICKGWNAGGGAFDRWHIRSTDISPKSFAGLASLARRQYDYCVAFHGMDVGGVLIGGGCPEELKVQIANAIRSAVGKGLEVGVADPTDVYNGDSPENIANWMTVGGLGGVQVEQSHSARAEHRDTIVDAIASVFAELL